MITSNGEHQLCSGQVNRTVPSFSARKAYYAPARPRQDEPVIQTIGGCLAENPMHGFDKLYSIMHRPGMG